MNFWKNWQRPLTDVAVFLEIHSLFPEIQCLIMAKIYNISFWIGKDPPSLLEVFRKFTHFPSQSRPWLRDPEGAFEKEKIYGIIWEYISKRLIHYPLSLGVLYKGILLNEHFQTIIGNFILLCWQYSLHLFSRNPSHLFSETQTTWLWQGEAGALPEQRKLDCLCLCLCLCEV